MAYMERRGVRRLHSRRGWPHQAIAERIGNSGGKVIGIDVDGEVLEIAEQNITYLTFSSSNSPMWDCPSY